MKFCLILALLAIIGCFASPTTNGNKNGNVNAYVTDYYGNFVTEKIMEAVDESKKYYAENYEKRIDPEDKIYVRASGKNLEREARLELTDSDGEGCAFDAEVQWGNNRMDGFHVDTCEDQISITKGGSGDKKRSKRSAKGKRKHKKKGKGLKKKNYYPDIIASKKQIKHASKNIKDLDLNFDVTIVCEFWNWGRKEKHVVYEQVKAFFGRSSFGAKSLNIRFTPISTYSKRSSKYSTNSSVEALEEFKEDIHTNNLYQFNSDNDVKTDAYILISDTITDRNVLAYVDSMGTDKNVAVVRNRGYQTADVIAQAIGHILGLNHPEDICKETSNSTYFIMEKAAHWNSTKLPDWSKCTKTISPWFLKKHKELLLDEIEFTNDDEEYEVWTTSEPYHIDNDDVCYNIAEQVIPGDIDGFELGLLRNYTTDPNICGVAYCDGGEYDPKIPGYTHHFTTYAIENERCAEEHLNHKALCTNGKCINRETGDEVINGGWGNWVQGECRWDYKQIEKKLKNKNIRCERKDTRECNNPAPENGGNSCGYEGRRISLGGLPSDRQSERTVMCEQQDCYKTYVNEVLKKKLEEQKEANNGTEESK